MLIGALGYEPLHVEVPNGTLAEFGLAPSDVSRLRVVGRHRGFQVLHIILAGGLTGDGVRRVAHAIYRRNPARRSLLILDRQGDGSLVFASWGLGPGPFRLKKLSVDPGCPRRSELDILAGLAARPDQTPGVLALAHIRALDREQVTRAFFTEFRRQRADLAGAITGISSSADGSAGEDRLELALIIMIRILFLYFLQRKGWLAGDPAYLHRLYVDARRSDLRFYARRLKPLFFQALNRPADLRGARARELGELPYLNGGLFERDAVERRHPRHDVPNESFDPLFTRLFERFQFTLREDESVEQDVAVDPEMLGRVFEGLMAGPTRGRTGAFYTPRPLVQQLVDGSLSEFLEARAGCSDDVLHSLFEDDDPPDIEPERRDRLADAVREVRVLDPAVGSGAFLLLVMQRLESCLDRLEGRPTTSFERFRRRQRIIERNLFGVDINGTAVRLCELRLWLALIVDLDVGDLSSVPPLPNLDLKIRQGDTLLDPVDFVLQSGDLNDRNLVSRWRRSVGSLVKRRSRYYSAAGRRKKRIGRALRRAERDLAVEFLGELGAQVDARILDLERVEAGEDLFGAPAALTRRQRRTLAALRRRRDEIRSLSGKISDEQELPFFSFAIHFSDPEHPDRRFDVVLGNPPWIRLHRWTGLPRARLQRRYRSLADGGWRAGSKMAGAGAGFGSQLDLSMLFLERGLEVLADGGVLGFLLPAKLARALYAGGVRERLARDLRIVLIEDAALASRRFFDATTYPLGLLVQRAPPAARAEVDVRLHTPDGSVLSFGLSQRCLSLVREDPRSAWALAPPAVRSVLDRMRSAGAGLGSRRRSRPRRGIFTGANDLFIGTHVGEPDAAGDLPVRLGGSTLRLPVDVLRPVLRGSDLEPWRFDWSAVLLWTHDDAGRVRPDPPPPIGSYLRQHAARLRRRRDLREGRPPWALFRVDPVKWGARVVWRDIGRSPGAVFVPDRVPFHGLDVPLVSLNTVYQVPVEEERDGHLLAAILNSLPGRAFLRTIAERAAGHHFRFFGWVVGLLPFPDEPDPSLVSELVELSRAAHERGGITSSQERSLAQRVGRLYGLEPGDLQTLAAFDRALGRIASR